MPTNGASRTRVPAHPNFVTKDSLRRSARISRIPKRWTRIVSSSKASSAADIAAQLWGKPDVWFMYEQVFLKEGGESRRTPWHQDSSYCRSTGRIRGDLDQLRAGRQGESLEFVRASHRGVTYDGRASILDDTAPVYGNGVIPACRISRRTRQVGHRVMGGESGRCVVFHPGCCMGARRRTGAFGVARCRCDFSATIRFSRAVRPRSKRPRRRFDATRRRMIPDMPSPKLERFSNPASRFAIRSF